MSGGRPCLEERYLFISPDHTDHPGRTLPGAGRDPAPPRPEDPAARPPTQVHAGPTHTRPGDEMKPPKNGCVLLEHIHHRGAMKHRFNDVPGIVEWFSSVTAAIQAKRPTAIYESECPFDMDDPLPDLLMIRPPFPEVWLETFDQDGNHRGFAVVETTTGPDDPEGAEYAIYITAFALPAGPQKKAAGPIGGRAVRVRQERQERGRVCTADLHEQGRRGQKCVAEHVRNCPRRGDASAGQHHERRFFPSQRPPTKTARD